MSSESIHRPILGSRRSRVLDVPPTPPRQSLFLLQACPSPQAAGLLSRIPCGAFCHTLSTGQPPLWNRVSPCHPVGCFPQAWQRWLRHPGGVRTGALESRPQASIFEGAAAPPPPPAYLGVLGCPGAPGTWKGQREHS